MRHDQTLTSLQSYQQLFASVVLAALDDAIVDEKARGNGVESITRWAQSRDGHTVLRCAGIEPGIRSIRGLQAFVRKGIKTSAALTRVKSLADLNAPEAELSATA